MKTQKISIVGGGIGGLTTAIALQQRGFDAHVYEAALEIKAVGAGILMAPNAIQVFDRLGLSNEIIQRGFPVERGAIKDVKGRLLQEFTPKDISSKHYPSVPIQRSRLQEILVQHLKPGTLHTGSVFASLDEHGTSAVVRFENGTEVESGIVIGADGIRSRVREKIFGEVQYRYSGQTCWRGLVEYTMPEPKVFCEMWGTKHGSRIGYSHVTDNTVYFFATANMPPGGRDEKGSIHAMLKEKFAEFPDFMQQMLAVTNECNILRNDIWDFAPIRSWHKGNIVLLGDAAHATTPNLGQGGCQAVEDGYILAKMLEEQATMRDAFMQYEQLRMKKATFVVETSYTAGRMVNLSGVMASLRNTALSFAPKNLGRKQMEYLFELNY